jgi:hypothetical protein
MTRVNMPPDHTVRGAQDRTWADDVEAELPPILETLASAGTAALDDETCARALVLAGRARQLSRPGDGLEALAIRAMPHVAELLARVPLTSPSVLIDRTEAALVAGDDGTDDPLDALLDDDDWLTTHGVATRANVEVGLDPVDFGETVGALISLCPTRLDELSAFAHARAAGMEERAHEAPAWEVLLDLWSAVIEASAHMALDGLSVDVRAAPARVSALTDGILSKFSVWAQDLCETVVGDVPVYNRRCFTVQRPEARGRGLPEVFDPIEIATWGSCQLVLTGRIRNERLAILQIERRGPDQIIAAERDGKALYFEPGPFGTEVADGIVGRYRVTIGDTTIEFEIEDEAEDT